jgi:hypothetical protein
VAGQNLRQVGYTQPEGIDHIDRVMKTLAVAMLSLDVDRAYYRWHPQKPFFVLSCDWSQQHTLSCASKYSNETGGVARIAAPLKTCRFITGTGEVAWGTTA